MAFPPVCHCCEMPCCRILCSAILSTMLCCAGHVMLCRAVQELLEEEVVNLEGFEWEVTDENTACGLCYTSGTTSRPKVWGGQVSRSRQSVRN